MMHDVGKFMNHQGHYRHTQYIIANSEIFGFSPEQRLVVSAIARYLGKSRPDARDRVMRGIPVEQHVQVTRAVVLLRLAVALNQDRVSAAVRMRPHVYPKRILLELVPGRGGAELEAWSLKKEADYFREVFRGSSLSKWRRGRGRCGGRAGPEGWRGPRVRLRRAIEPLRSRMLAGLVAAEGTRSVPRKSVRLGLWPTTRRFSAWAQSRRSFWKSLEGGGGGESVGLEDLGLVAGLGADKGGGLEAALEGAGDDEVELNVEGVEDVGELEAVPLALLVEGPLGVEDRVGSARSGAGVAKDE